MTLRQTVNALVTIQNPKDAGDLLNPALTQDHLIALINRAAAPAAAGGLGFKLLLTSIHSSHGSDAVLGPHGHSGGFAVDIGAVNGTRVGDNPATIEFVRAMLANNAFVTKVGTLQQLVDHRDLQAVASAHGKQLFLDAGTGPHVHLQTK
jgi:hypothetical protein